MFLFNNPIICVILIGTIYLIPTFYVLFKIEKLNHTISEMTSVLFHMLKKANGVSNDAFDIKQMEETNAANLNTLSSGVRYFIEQQQHALNDKIMPTPSLSEMIGITIKEQIATEEMLSHNMRIPNPLSTEKIIKNVCKTYPHVDEEYLSKRCLAQIEAHVQKVMNGEE